ncbi:MAG: hypothetical protein DI626_06615 [Micavibrio aeruginosavorus]|uniref:Glycerophosphoryl diester phosphodiesterase membrane domain-containing protein n=1 Tax=Micavibrio aeruginosavorus TaxID=349221 RepID=A0A2W5BTE9_9BACT|nr:MAG: hypothetical protein DI626_06615 [Micavibrio aeruginosavorus]
MSKPGTISLSREAFYFMRQNLGTFAAHLKYALPLVIVIAVIKQAMVLNGMGHLSLILMIPSFFIYGCFVLSWHRVALNGPDSTKPVNPFAITGEELKFILTFAGLTGAFSLILSGMTYIAENFVPVEAMGMVLIANIVMLAATLAAMYWFLRLSFLFPAQAQGVALTLGDVLRTSRGMAWKLFGVNFMAGLLFIVAFSVYGLVAGMIATVSGGDDELSRVAAASMGLVLSIPVHIAIFFIIATCITALSRAYQWGMQNNPVE